MPGVPSSRSWSAPQAAAAFGLDTILLALGLCAAAAFYSATLLNHDTSWYLTATAWWLAGAELYRDISEVNPPLAFYMTAPAIFLSQATGIARETSFVLVTLSTAALSLFWFRHLCRSSPFMTGTERSIMLIAAFAAACATPIANFGQREHLMLLLVLPYIALVAFKAEAPSTERAAIGVLAAAGFALKPHFLVVPALLAMLMILRQRRFLAPFTAEHLTLGITCAGYLAFVAICHPLYFSEILPAALLVYDAYAIDPSKVAFVPAYFAIAGLAVMARSLPLPRDRQVACTLLVVSLGFVIAYVLQYKGWEYQRIPIYSSLCLLGAWIGSAALRISNRSRFERLAMGGLLCAVLVVVAQQVVSGPYSNRFTTLLEPTVSRGERFMALTATVSVTYPLANKVGAEPTSRYSALWLLPGAAVRLAERETLAPETRSALEQLLDAARTTTAEDLLKGDPDVVLVDVRPDKPYFGGVAFDYVDFFSRNERFAERWRDYRLAYTVAGFEVWRRLDREPPAPPAVEGMATR